MKRRLLRIAVLLVAIMATALAGFTVGSTPQASTYCNAKKVQYIPPGYQFVDYSNCDGQEYEIWQHPDIATFIRRPGT